MNRLSPLLPGSFVAALLLAPVPAHACGGTFCDSQPDPMPVDQTGEDILFVLDGSTVEVHIRIEYTGEAERFAWIVPLQAIPEVSVGSEPLFDALRNAAGANWRTNTRYDCSEDNPNWGGGGGGGFTPISDLGGGDDPSVVYEATVGAFDVVVLKGGTASEVIDFLDANDYAQDPDAEPILQEYLDEGFLFAAVKLTDDVGVDAIHPLVFRLPGDEPCVPIRLTRIAAADDMGIRVYFLGTERWVPSNYRHVELNPLAYDWQAFAPERFFELLGAAVDEAGGRAFVTDYAGSSQVINTFSVYSPSWDETAFVDLAASDVVGELGSQNLLGHPLVPALLAEFFPPPPEFAQQPWSYWTNLDEYRRAGEWDAAGFAAALAERVIDPGMHAADLVETWPKLTRLSTSISAHEMMVDPIFHANPTLPDVNRADVITVEQVLCGGDSIFHVEYEGADKPVCVPSDAAYPGWSDMPASLWSGQMPMVGGPQIIDDNRAEIEASYQRYQSGVGCATIDDDGDGEDGDGDGTGPPPVGVTFDGSCACTTQGGAAPVGAALGVLMLGLLGCSRKEN